MKKDQYFNLEVNFLSNDNIVRMMMELDAAQSLGIYMMLLTHLRKADNYEASCCPLCMGAFARMYDLDADVLQRVLREFDLFVLDEERQMFLEEIGLKESGVNRLIRSAYSLLNLETYFTTGPDETRAWTYTRGTKAPQAAGIIHTDFERGFIRAEVIKYDDYVRLGSEKACREAGKIGIEGKEYVVQDGDIMHFLFNV